MGEPAFFWSESCSWTSERRSRSRGPDDKTKGALPSRAGRSPASLGRQPKRHGFEIAAGRAGRDYERPGRASSRHDDPLSAVRRKLESRAPATTDSPPATFVTYALRRRFDSPRKPLYIRGSTFIQTAG